MPSTLSKKPLPRPHKKSSVFELYFESTPDQVRPIPLTATINHPAFQKATISVRPAKKTLPAAIAAQAKPGYQVQAGALVAPRSFSAPKSTAEVLHLSSHYQQLLLPNHGPCFLAGGSDLYAPELREGDCQD